MPEISHKVHPAPFIRAITPGSGVLDPMPRGLYVGTGGTITVDNGDGTTAEVPVVAGTMLPVQPTKITAATDAVVFGLYDR